MSHPSKLNEDSDEFNFEEEFYSLPTPAEESDLEKFRKAMGYTAEVGPEFKGNDIELQVDLEKLIENNPVAQVALRDMMARTGGDLSKILRNLQPGDRDYATDTRGTFSGYTGRNKEAVLRNESTYNITYNATDVFDTTTDKGKGFVALLEKLKIEGDPYPKILEVYKMLPDGSKVFNKEYYNSLSETQKTILQVKAENKENTLNTIIHELMHYGYQTLNDRGYISDALYKDIENLNTYGFVDFDTKEHVLIQEILTGDGKIPPQTDLQLLANADPKELYEFNKEKIARRLASEDLNTNPNIEVSYKDLVEKYLTLPDVEINKLRLEGVDYFTAQKPSKSYYEENPDYVSMEDENNPNVLEYNRATNQEYLDNLASEFGVLSYQDTDDYFAENLYRNDPMGGPFNPDFSNASYNMQRESGKYLDAKKSLQDQRGNISPITKGNIGGLNKGLTPLKFATIHGANEWLAKNDNPDVKQNLNTQTTKAFERPDNNPRAGYESGQDYLNENRGLPSYLSDGPMEGPNSFQPEPETYTGPVPELMAEGGFVTGMNWWKDNDPGEIEIEDLTGEEELKFAEGGPVVELEEQTEMAFGNGSARVDPVSGNEVPPGALPSEVRDDIPARLSEGEYVVPADVLQYYGIKFFEDLRGKAKMELSGMEQNGRMGGEPLEEDHVSLEEMPFGAEELQSYDDGQEAPAQGFNEGGPVTEAASMFPTTMIKTYINEAGSKLYIRFVNGIAIPPVPPGYVEEGSTIDAVVAPTTPTSPDQGNDESDGGEPRVFLKDFGAMSAQELARFAGETADTTLNKVLGGRLGSGQNKAWEAFVEKVQNNGTFAQIEYVNNLNTMKKAGDRDGLMNLSGDLTHSDIMATGSEKTDSKNAGTGAKGSNFTFVAPDESLKDEIVGKDSGAGKASVMKDNKVLTPGKPGTKYSPSMENKIEAAKEAEYDNEIEKQTAVGQVTGKGYVGGFGFNKGGLATRKKKKK